MTATALPRVLLVDDERQLSESHQRALLDAPFEVEIADHAMQALSRLDEGGIDVVCSDERVPGLSGGQLLTKVRERWPHVVRVLLAGHASVDAAMTSVNQAGVFRFLTKPCPPDVLQRTLEEAVALRRLSERASTTADLTALSALERDFDAALSQVWLAHQPIVDIATGRTLGYELLVRSDSEAMPFPDRLFDAAGRLGRVQELERRIRRAATQCVRDLPEGVWATVNIEPQTLLDPMLYRPDSPLAAVADRVVLEVTERDKLDTIEDVAGRLVALRELGYRVAIDDLGAGYAGLNAVVTLQPDIVKLDRELVHGIHDSPIRGSLVAGIVASCRELGLHVIGEGVENPADLRRLARMNCSWAQGYLLGRPARDPVAPDPERTLRLAGLR